MRFRQMVGPQTPTRGCSATFADISPYLQRKKTKKNEHLFSPASVTPTSPRHLANTHTHTHSVTHTHTMKREITHGEASEKSTFFHECSFFGQWSEIFQRNVRCLVVGRMLSTKHAHTHTHTDTESAHVCCEKICDLFEQFVKVLRDFFLSGSFSFLLLKAVLPLQCWLHKRALETRQSSQKTCSIHPPPCQKLCGCAWRF